jgi:hypothetical protein
VSDGLANRTEEHRLVLLEDCVGSHLGKRELSLTLVTQTADLIDWSASLPEVTNLGRQTEHLRLPGSPTHDFLFWQRSHLES